MPTRAERFADHGVTDAGAEAGFGVGQGQQVDATAGLADLVQAPEVGGAGFGDGAEDMEEGTVDNGVVGRCEVGEVAEGEGVCDLKADVGDVVGFGVGAGVVDGAGGEVDAEHVVAEAGQQDGVFAGAAAGFQDAALDLAGDVRVRLWRAGVRR